MAYDPKVERASVVDTPKYAEGSVPVHPFILQVAALSSSITPWGTNVSRRDKELRQLWVEEPWLSSTVYGVTTRNASFTWEVKGADPSKKAPKNTISAVTRMLKASDRGLGWFSLIQKTCQDLYCLAGTTRVSLGGERSGQTKYIRDMVQDKDPGPVISLDENGKLVECYINQWHKTPLGDRKWYWLSAELVSGHVRERRGGIFMTEDHPMLTQRGWVQAKDITLSDKIATADPLPSEDQAEVMVGGLLGDMNITSLPNRSLLRFSHSIDQNEYLEFKKSLLSGFSWTGQKVYKSKMNSLFIGVNSRASAGLNSWRSKWYPSDKKVINKEDIIRYFSPRMLAIWFMDDGAKQTCTTTAGNTSTHGILSVQGFSLEDIEWLVILLNSKGFFCKIQAIQQGKYHVIRFSSEGFKALSDYMGMCIIPSMRYKVLEDAPEYDPLVWEMDSADIYYDKIVTIEQREYLSGKKPCQTTYHIGVENTRNFVAAGLISHNTQDNGAFWELIRPSRSAQSPVINIAHLDAGRCRRTGDPAYPVIYTNRYGIERALRWWEVVPLAEMPSGIEDMYGAQVCAVSRALLNAEYLRDLAVFKKEKVSGGNPQAIDFVSNVTDIAIEDALARAQEGRLNRGLYRYFGPVIVSGLDPTGTLSNVHIDIAALPDGYDEDTTVKWYIAQLANAFGVDYQEIAPLMTGNLGTSQQSEILHLKTRGKGPALIMGIFENVLNNYGILPSNVVFRYKEQDIRSESEKADASFTRSKARSMMLKSGEIDAEAARELAVLAGDIPEHMVSEIESRQKKREKEEQQRQDEISQMQPEVDDMQAEQIEGGEESHNQQKALTMDDIERLMDKMENNETLLQEAVGALDYTKPAPAR